MRKNKLLKWIGISFLCLVVSIYHADAQELNCTVQISSEKIQSDKTVFDNMQKAVFEFMNTTKWTGDVFNVEERIECSILLIIKSRNGSDEFVVDFQVQASRPVFNSTYTTTLLSLKESDLNIKFQQFEQLQYVENQYQSEFISLLSYYAYLILAYDYDTFAPLGGTPYFEKALSIVNLCQNSPNQGWTSGFKDEVTRFWLVTNSLNQFFQPLRTCWYEYHIQGLDKLHLQQPSTIDNITNALKKIEQVHASKPNWSLTQMFFRAKADEIVNLYNGAPRPLKIEMTALLQKLNPGNTQKYQKLLSAG